ncbi:MAG: hypothetical protein IPM77_07385 [Crocinitomicaceae bacterium]|nr:hypothetical protein [Crocinitomicaceae bacterium]
MSALTDYTKLKNFSKLDWNKKNEPESFLIVYSCSNDLLYYEKNLSLTLILNLYSLLIPVFAQNKTFEYTGDYQRYVVPNGVYSLQVDLYGASGGWNDYSGVKYEEYTPGKGGRVQATIPVHPGQTLYIFVGGKGGDGSSGVGGTSGFNGGGSGKYIWHLQRWRRRWSNGYPD